MLTLFALDLATLRPLCIANSWKEYKTHRLKFLMLRKAADKSTNESLQYPVLHTARRMLEIRTKRMTHGTNSHDDRRNRILRYSGTFC